ncbi:MAG: Veg family protein [Clostridiales bacterium]|jgi:uncharacterized protein Veg|nr:Veg family protein [Clostridiales bacterium]
MRKCVLSINEVKRSVHALVGQKLKISVNKGRKKIVRYDGEIDGVYPGVFTLKISDDKNVNKLSFSYSDVICGDIKLIAVPGATLNKWGGAGR